MVIYFTATGNSRYVAQAVADRLNDEAVGANSFIKEKRKGSFKSGKPWVFVFPIYLSAAARIFIDFIKESELEGSKKAYFIATCASAMGAAPNICADLCKEKSLEFMGAVKVKMPQNYIALFTMTEPEEIERRLSAADLAADEISALIAEEKPFETKLVSGVEYSATKMVEKLYNGHFTGTKKFFVTDRCTGCGSCAKLCPLNNITLSDKKPIWKAPCIHCMACINLCPKQAIEYGKGTAGKKRYVCKKYKSEKTK